MDETKISDRPVALTSLDPRQRAVIRIHMVLAGAVPTALLAIGDTVADSLLLQWPYGIATGIALFIYLVAIVGLPGRRWRRWGYHMGADAIRIASGWLVRRETIVPFVRVQHIDVSRGPLERAFGVARLTLHTAGSYNSTVALPGLALADAERIREEIRAHIREDLP